MKILNLMQHFFLSKVQAIELNSLPCSDTETKVAYNNSVTMKDSNKISRKREEIFLSFNLGFQLYFN